MLAPPTPAPRPRRAALAAVGLCAALAGAGCGVVVEDRPTCTGKCDSLDTELEGLNDPIAKFLRAENVTDDGLIEGDYLSFLIGLTKIQNCSLNSVTTFVVADDLLTGGESFPRLVSVACSSDDVKASEFFMAASFEEFDGDGPTGDVSMTNVEMFAWDKLRREYHFYAFQSAGDGFVKIEVEPDRCRSCHLTPSDVDSSGMRMTPIMNELNRPWTHWNASPGFESHSFDLPEGIEDQPHFKHLATSQQGAASRLEEIIRFGGHAKVTSSRLRDRRRPADIDEVMQLLRPLFCSEQINYVSEDHDSGILFNAAIVDPGIRNMFLQVRATDWPWSWTNDKTLRLPLPDGEESVNQIPVRGHVDANYENQLVALGALDAMQVLRLRALDWEQPVFSELRCGLWRAAVDRFAAEAPEFMDGQRNLDVMKNIFDEMLIIGAASVDTADEDLFVALRRVEDGSVLTDLEEDLADLGAMLDLDCAESPYCLVDVDSFGNLLDERLTNFETAPDPREMLLEMRRRRICHVIEVVEPADDRFDAGRVTRYEARPSLPEVTCN